MGAGAGASAPPSSSSSPPPSYLVPPLPSPAPADLTSKSLRKLGTALIGKTATSTSHSYDRLSSLLAAAQHANLSTNDLHQCGLHLLDHAATVSRLDIMELLLSHVCTNRTKQGMGIVIGGFPLHKAADSLQTDAVELLLGANVVNANDCDPFGQTALHKICGKKPSPSDPSREDQAEVIACLLMHGMSKPALLKGDSIGNSCLHLACKNNNITLAALLLSKNASLKSLNKKKKTPADMAFLNGHDKLGKALQTGSIGVLLRKEERKRHKGRRADANQIDINQAMEIWNKFFENAMKSNELRSRDDSGLTRSSHSQHSLAGTWTPRDGKASVSDVETKRREVEEKRREVEERRARRLKEIETTRRSGGSSNFEFEFKSARAQVKKKLEKTAVEAALEEATVWTRIMDDESNVVYYHDDEGGVSVWEEPATGIVTRYIVMHDSEYGRDFYFDDEEGESYWTWPPPEEEDGEQQQQQQAPAPEEKKEQEQEQQQQQQHEQPQTAHEQPPPQQLVPADPENWLGWLEYFDDTQSYFMNLSSFETSWSMPEKQPVMLYDATTTQYYYHWEGEGSRWSLSPYHCVKDESTGCAYYSNSLTGESKWELNIADVNT